MGRTWVRTQGRERVRTLAAAGLGDRELRHEVLAVLRGAIDFSAYVWLLTDPVTEVGSAPLADVPALAELPALIKAKYATPVNRWTALRRQATPVGLLSAAGDPARSRVWREVLSRYQIGDVASVVFADQYGCWGFLDLWRDAVQGPFGTADADYLASLTAPLARALRECQARTFLAPAATHRRDAGPVVLTLDDTLRIVRRTAASQAWLDVLLPPGPGQQAIPASVYNVAAQLLAAEQGIDSHPATARTHLSGGFWLTLRAARLPADHEPAAATGSGPAIVVTIEEAAAADRLDLFSRAHCLTAREGELLGLLATGGDTRAIARHMSVSELTVQDHLKSVFGKTGARDRITLLARALGTQRLPGGVRQAATASRGLHDARACYPHGSHLLWREAGQRPDRRTVMSHSSEPAASPAAGQTPSRPQARHVENVIMSALVRAGLIPRSYLLTTRGRKTGRARTNPVVPVEHGGRRWLVAPYGPVSWVHNARAAGRVTLTRRRDVRDYAIREVAPEEAGPVLKRYVRIAPAARGHFQASKDSPVPDFIAEAGRHPVFELTPRPARDSAR